MLLLLALFLTVTEEEAGAETEMGQPKTWVIHRYRNRVNHKIIEKANLLNDYSKGQTESNMQKLDFMFILDPVACILALDLQLKF